MYADYDVIKHFVLGAVVIPLDYDETKRGVKKEMCDNSVVSDIGHVTGFSLNSCNEVIVNIAFASGKTGQYHPSRLMVI